MAFGSCVRTRRKASPCPVGHGRTRFGRRLGKRSWRTGDKWPGRKRFAQGIEDFPFDTERDGDADEPQWFELFISWQLYDWIPPGEATTVAKHWLRETGSALSVPEDVRRMVESADKQSLSFYQVQAVDRGRGAVLRNLLIDEERFVVDRSLSEAIPPWTLLFGRLVEFGGITIFDAAGYRALPPDILDELMAIVEDTVDASVPLPKDILAAVGTDLVENLRRAAA